MNFEIRPLPAGLYIVATPIGAARDITLRALDILASADVLAAEDTRTLRRLMDIHGIPLGQRRILACHDHSGPGVLRDLVAAIAAGRSVAYASEAGTPLVSDPGFELTRAVIAAGLPLTAAPGPSALLDALVLSGLPADRVAFAGFLPPARAQRLSALAGLAGLPFTLVFYESPKRIGEMLGDLCEVFGGARRAAVARELTKKFEDVRRGTLAELADALAGETLRGECVVVVDRPGEQAVADTEVEAALRRAMRTMRMKDAATAVAGALGLPRREVYRVALGLAEKDGAEEA
jgi:16S rRNA (cytidine1402-2'-O)-methyltransferase